MRFINPYTSRRKANNIRPRVLSELVGFSMLLLVSMGTPPEAEAQSTSSQPTSTQTTSSQTSATPYLDTTGSDPNATDAGPLDWEKEFEHLGRVYKNDKNDTVQEVWLLGRYHGQYHWTEANVGESDYYETRRFRLGAQA